jgi:hypothetical protein
MKLIPNLIPNWWRTLLRAWSIRIAALGILSPEVLQIIADNTDSLQWLDGGYKSGIRLACLIGVVLARPVKQGAL